MVLAIAHAASASLFDTVRMAVNARPGKQEVTSIHAASPYQLQGRLERLMPLWSSRSLESSVVATPKWLWYAFDAFNSLLRWERIRSMS